MTSKEAQKVLDELNGVRPEVLTGEAKRLFEAIMKIADERDELRIQIKEKEKIINNMTKYILEMDIDEDICKKIKEPCKNYAGDNNKLCDECIKDFFNKN